MLFTKEELKDFNLVLKKASLEYTPPCCNICHSIIHEYMSGIQYEYGKTLYTCGTYCNHCGCYTPLGSICIADDTQERDSYEIPLETLCQAIHINENTLNNKPTPGYNEERDLLVKKKKKESTSQKVIELYKENQKLIENKDLFEIGLLIGNVSHYFGKEVSQALVIEINRKLDLNLPTHFDVEVKYS